MAKARSRARGGPPRAQPCTTSQGLRNDPLARGTKVARVARALPTMSKQQLAMMVVHPLASKASRGAITGARGPR